eukprot:217948-Pyramimonas_sp.AAC.1
MGGCPCLSIERDGNPTEYDANWPPSMSKAALPATAKGRPAAMGAGRSSRVPSKPSLRGWGAHA